MKKTILAVMLGVVLGGAVVALVLDGRGAAMVKAFNNPTAVNQTNFGVEVVVKK